MREGEKKEKQQSRKCSCVQGLSQQKAASSGVHSDGFNVFCPELLVSKDFKTSISEATVIQSYVIRESMS